MCRHGAYSSNDCVGSAKALKYRERIMAAVPEGSTFQPLMTLYLTDNTPPEEVERAWEAGIAAFKLYPAGATTNSDSGVTSVHRVLPTLHAMSRVCQLPCAAFASASLPCAASAFCNCRLLLLLLPAS
jgi:dihydroorotase